MTRIEDENGGEKQIASMQSEIEKLKKDLKRKQSKKFFNCGTCLIILLLIIFAVCSVAAYIMARSGWKTIPIFSDYFYSSPQPTYLVKSLDFNQQLLINRLEKTVASEALSARKTEDLTVNFEISDEEITALFREQLAKEPAFAERIDYWQIATVEGHLELFLRLKKPEGLILVLKITPEVKDGRIELKVKSFKIGQLRLPGFVGSILIENIGEKLINQFLASWNDYGQLEEITVYNYLVKLKVIINNTNNLKNAF